jgi:nucleotide-binding universal stress UspA family protein
MEVVAQAGRVAQLTGAHVTVLHVMSQVAATPLAPRAGGLKVVPLVPDPPKKAAYQLDDLQADAEQLIAEGTREGAHLKEALALLAEMDVPARALVRHGLVIDEISEEACEGDYDLVVIGTHPTRGWMRHLLSDLEHQLLGCCRDRLVLVAKPQ